MHVMLPHTHAPGRHCASTAVSDLCRFHGFDADEALCFGLGQGLGIWVVALPGISPSRIVHVRSHDYESTFFAALGVPFAWQRDPDPVMSEAALREALEDGRPALVTTDIKHLPYFGSSAHFPGHLVAVWGYDDHPGVFSVSDTERPELQTVPYLAMRAARYSTLPHWPHQGDFFAPAAIPTPPDLPVRMRQAIVQNSRALLEPSLPFAGIAALDAWLDELDAWAELPDLSWTARFAYQTIEKRGTGGGGFRLLYAEFLDQAAAALPAVAAAALPERMRAAATAWTALATALKDLSDTDDPDPRSLAAPLAAVRDAEADYHRRALSLA